MPNKVQISESQIKELKKIAARTRVSISLQIKKALEFYIKSMNED